MKNSHFAKIASIVALAALATTGAQAADKTWAWDYQLSATSPASGTQRPTSGKNKAEMWLDKGVYTFRLRGNTAPTCFTTEETAAVTEDDTTFTVVPTPRFANCEKIRFVIKKDGTGGKQQNMVGKKGAEQWEDADGDVGLTAR